MPAIKLATFNINNVNGRLPNLLSWLKRAKPDVVCLQELKCESKDFPASELQKAGYNAVWVGETRWNGVAILGRKMDPILIRNRLPGDKDDHQARYIEAAVNGIVVASIYLPNGNPQPGPKFEYKMDWFARLKKHASSLAKSGVPVVLAGDFNVAPTSIDIYPTRSWDKDALIQPRPRKAFADLVAKGWTDSLRSTYADERIYTFWSYWRTRYERDVGLRLDHILLNDLLSERILHAGVDRKIRGEVGASDHAPAWVNLK